MVGLPVLAVVAAAWAFTASLWASAVLLLMLASMLVQLGGAMYLAGIQVNAGVCWKGGVITRFVITDRHAGIACLCGAHPHNCRGPRLLKRPPIVP